MNEILKQKILLTSTKLSKLSFSNLIKNIISYFKNFVWQNFVYLSVISIYLFRIRHKKFDVVRKCQKIVYMSKDDKIIDLFSFFPLINETNF